jgi:hypothetical protein
VRSANIKAQIGLMGINTISQMKAIMTRGQIAGVIGGFLLSSEYKMNKRQEANLAMPKNMIYIMGNSIKQLKISTHIRNM